jgi:hypothetical protein
LINTPRTAQGTTNTKEGKESSSGLYVDDWGLALVIIQTVPSEKVMKRICGGQRS